MSELDERRARTVREQEANPYSSDLERESRQDGSFDSLTKKSNENGRSAKEGGDAPVTPQELTFIVAKALHFVDQSIP